MIWTRFEATREKTFSFEGNFSPSSYQKIFFSRNFSFFSYHSLEMSKSDLINTKFNFINDVILFETSTGKGLITGSAGMTQYKHRTIFS